jgi:uncharacterized protein YceH (UPF0502 family)
MGWQLNVVEQRVLGALMEKESATPEQYPLSLNALVNACNQRSSRDPVMELDEEAVRQALHTLEDQGFVRVAHDSRVPKFEHLARTVLQLRRDETAIICLLLLRGPQTPGELRTRADRLHAFDDLPAVTAALERLACRPSIEQMHGEAATQGHTDGGARPEVAKGTGPLVIALARQPGSREPRYAHLLGGMPDSTSAIHASAQVPGDPGSNHVSHSIDALAAAVDALTTRVALLEERLLALETTGDVKTFAPVH